MAPIKFDTHKKTVNSVNKIKHWTKGGWELGAMGPLAPYNNKISH